MVFAAMLLTGVSCLAQTDTLVYQDLRYGWMAVSENGTLRAENISSAEVVAIELPEVSKTLRISSAFSIDIWVNDQLKRSDFRGTLHWEVDALFTQDQDRLITFYGPSGFAHELSTELIELVEPTSVVISASQRAEIIREVFAFQITVILIFLGLFRRYFPVAFGQSFRNPLASRVRSLSDESSYDSFFNLDNLFALGFLSFLLSAVLLYIERAPVIFWGDHSFWGYTLNWLLLAGILAAVLFLKFALYQVLALVFDFKVISNIQAQDLIRFFIFMSAFAFTLAIIDFTIFGLSSAVVKNLTAYLLVAALIIFTLGVFFKLDKFLSHRKLMIIAYLCTTEFLPGYLLITWLVR